MDFEKCLICGRPINDHTLEELRRVKKVYELLHEELKQDLKDLEALIPA